MRCPTIVPIFEFSTIVLLERLISVGGSLMSIICKNKIKNIDDFGFALFNLFEASS